MTVVRWKGEDLGWWKRISLVRTNEGRSKPPPNNFWTYTPAPCRHLDLIICPVYHTSRVNDRQTDVRTKSLACGAGSCTERTNVVVQCLVFYAGSTWSINCSCTRLRDPFFGSSISGLKISLHRYNNTQTGIRCSFRLWCAEASIPLLAMAQFPLASTQFRRGGLFSVIGVHVSRCPNKEVPGSRPSNVTIRITIRHKMPVSMVSKVAAKIGKLWV